MLDLHMKPLGSSCMRFINWARMPNIQELYYYGDRPGENFSNRNMQAWSFGNCSTRVSGQCCFTSTETIRLIRDGESRTAASTFTQLLSSEKRATAQLKGCPASRGAVQARLRQSSRRQGMKHAANIDFRPTLLGVVKSRKGVAAVSVGVDDVLTLLLFSYRPYMRSNQLRLSDEFSAEIRLKL